MRALQHFFRSRIAREKALLLAFAGLALLTLGSHVLGRGRSLWNDWRSARAESATQQVWLDHADEIATRAAAATRSLEPAKTLNATRLVGELSNLAAQAGLTADIGSQRTERTDQFAFHTVQVNFRRGELPALLRFYAALGERSPYIALEQLSVATDRTNPGQLNASLRIVSVELAQ
jgi:hypothetical protein